MTEETLREVKIIPSRQMVVITNPTAQKHMHLVREADAEPDYTDYLKGKTVAVIGGADNYDQEQVCKDYEVIVRINNHWVRQGGICDVLYHTMVGREADPAPLMQDHFRPSYMILNVTDPLYDYGYRDLPAYATFSDWARSNWPVKVGFFTHVNWVGQNPYEPELEWLNTLHKRYECKLFTGLVAVADILRRDIKELFICGMDFYFQEMVSRRARIFKETGGAVPFMVQRDTHAYLGNLRCLLDAKETGRVILDAPLQGAVDAFLKEYGGLPPREDKPQIVSVHQLTPTPEQFLEFVRNPKRGVPGSQAEILAKIRNGALKLLEQLGNPNARLNLKSYSFLEGEGYHEAVAILREIDWRLIGEEDD